MNPILDCGSGCAPQTELPDEICSMLEAAVDSAYDGSGKFRVGHYRNAYLENAFYAAVVLDILWRNKRVDFVEKYRKDLINYALQFRTAAGCFADDPDSASPTIFATFYSLSILHLMKGLTPEIADSAATSLAKFKPGDWPAEGKFGSSLAVDWWYFSSLRLCGKLTNALEREIAGHVRQCMLPNGSFRCFPQGGTGTLQSTTIAVLLTNLCAEPVLEQAEQVRISHYLTECRTKDGGYGDVPGVSSSPASDLAGAILAHLTGASPSLKKKRFKTLWEAYCYGSAACMGG